jgi:flagellar assembly protein FliH
MGANDRISETIPKDRLGESAPFEFRQLAGGRRVGDAGRLSPRPSDEERAKTGYAAGLAQGQAEAQRDAQRLRAADLQRLESLLGHLRGEFDGLAGRLADTLLDLAVDIAGQVLRHEVQARRDAIVPVVREALALVEAARSHPTIRLAPVDFDVVRAALHADGHLQGCRLVADATVAPGGCRLESASAEVDATLQTRWRRVLQTIGVGPVPLPAEGEPAAPDPGGAARETPQP